MTYTIPANTAVAAPGAVQLDPDMAMPRTVTATQVVLWVFAVVATIADVVSAVNMAELVSPFSIVSLAYVLYSTVQTVVTSLGIRLGKRWAWVWALVSAVLGLVVAVGSTMRMVAVDVPLAPILIGGALVGLYGTLIILLGSKSVRMWIMVQRLKRNKVQTQGAPGPGLVPVAVRVLPTQAPGPVAQIPGPVVPAPEFNAPMEPAAAPMAPAPAPMTPRQRPAAPRPWRPAPQPWSPMARTMVFYQPPCSCPVTHIGPHRCAVPAPQTQASSQTVRLPQQRSGRS
ncbi:hypothetical protein [Glycomyces sp. NPDC048151]|uniref:hypothetical protein n=1 Tax=Glycomyces sp. NPDC048151 TaxID=3364002 RepID=UPI00371E856B